MPYASIEWADGTRLRGAALHTLPSPVPHGNRKDQWWSLGVMAEDEGTELVLLSGPCASNGRHSVVKASQRGFVPYRDAYLNVPPGAVIEKTFTLQRASKQRLWLSSTPLHGTHHCYCGRIGICLSSCFSHRRWIDDIYAHEQPLTSRNSGPRQCAGALRQPAYRAVARRRLPVAPPGNQHAVGGAQPAGRKWRDLRPGAIHLLGRTRRSRPLLRRLHHCMRSRHHPRSVGPISGRFPGGGW